MIWVVAFVILGAATLVAVLYGLIAAWRNRRALVTTHLLALALVILAWSLGHPETLGRIALAAAIGLEVFAWFGIRHDAPLRRPAGVSNDSRASSLFAAEPMAPFDAHVEFAEPIHDTGSLHDDEPPDVGEAIAMEVPADPPAVVAPQRKPVEEPSRAASRTVQMTTARNEICIRSYALLSRPYHVTLPVLLASIKRAGIREASLVEPADADAPAYIAIRGLKAGISVAENRRDREQIESSLAQSDLLAEAIDSVRAHGSHIAVDIAYDAATSRADAVRTALSVHSALTEFAPLVAVLWPESGQAAPAVHLSRNMARIDDDPSEAAVLCAKTRRFDLDGANEGLTLFDSLGFAAFGLPDAQVVVASADDNDGAAALRELMRHMLLEGCDLPDGAVHSLADGTSWRIKYTRSAFDPDREVVQIRPEVDAGRMTGETGLETD